MKRKKESRSSLILFDIMNKHSRRLMCLISDDINHRTYNRAIVFLVQNERYRQTDRG
jgi:hypothetical protein